MDLPTWLSDITIGSVLISVVAFLGIVRISRQLSVIISPMVNMMQDFNGRPARPGYNAEPGIPERLQKLENAIGSMNLTLSQLQTDLKMLKDKYIPESERKYSNVPYTD